MSRFLNSDFEISGFFLAFLDRYPVVLRHKCRVFSKTLLFRFLKTSEAESLRLTVRKSLNCLSFQDVLWGFPLLFIFISVPVSLNFFELYITVVFYIKMIFDFSMIHLLFIQQSNSISNVNCELLKITLFQTSQKNM